MSASDPIDKSLQTVCLRDDFYRDGFYKVVSAAAILLTSILLLSGVAIYFLLYQPPLRYFAATEKLRIVPTVPVDQPKLKPEEVVQWVSEIVPAVYTYDFVNYTTTLEQAQSHFTDAGWERFKALLDNTGLMDEIENVKEFITTHASGAPVILNQGLLEGHYAWWVDMPLEVSRTSYQGGVSVVKIEVQVLVVRIPTENNVGGIAIDNVILVNDQSGTQGWKASE